MEKFYDCGHVDYSEEPEFYHKVIQNVIIAMQSLHASHYTGGLKKERCETIDRAKLKFQENLQNLISGRLKLDLPEKYSHELFWEMLMNSDFDWKDESLLVGCYIPWLKEKGL